MKKYLVEMKETNSACVEVEANSKEEAKEKAETLYYNDEVDIYDSCITSRVHVKEG